MALHTGPEDLYCVCGTLSILADNTARAAGVTFLPLGQKWLNTALFSLEPGLLKQYALKYGINAAEVRIFSVHDFLFFNNVLFITTVFKSHKVEIVCFPRAADRQRCGCSSHCG